MFLQFLINGLITGLLYSLAAVGFALVYNTTGIFHIAAAAVYTGAAYCFWFCADALGLPIVLAGVLALAFAALLNVGCEVAVYRPLGRRGTPPTGIMIASIGLMAALVNLVAMCFGNETKIVDNTIRPSLRLGELILSRPQGLQLVIGGLALIAFAVFLRMSLFGLKTRALGNNATLYSAYGYDAGRTRLGVFALGGVFLGAASCLSAYDVGMSPHVGMSVLVNAMVAMIVGGVGRFVACVAGGLLLGVLQALAVWQFAANWQPAVTFLLLLLFLFLRPQGLFGVRRRIV